MLSTTMLPMPTDSASHCCHSLIAGDMPDAPCMKTTTGTRATARPCAPTSGPVYVAPPVARGGIATQACSTAARADALEWLQDDPRTTPSGATGREEQ